MTNVYEELDKAAKQHDEAGEAPPIEFVPDHMADVAQELGQLREKLSVELALSTKATVQELAKLRADLREGLAMIALEIGHSGPNPLSEKTEALLSDYVKGHKPPNVTKPLET